jgi:hypothetical protein
MGISSLRTTYMLVSHNNQLNMVWTPVPGIMVQLFEVSHTRDNILHLFKLNAINYKIRNQLIYLVCRHALVFRGSTSPLSFLHSFEVDLDQCHR